MVLHQCSSRMPSPLATLSLFGLASHLAAAHVVPRETKPADTPSLSIVSWPIVATPAPDSPRELLRRQAATVCGFIGGDPNLPATCLAGSHCAADVAHGVIGCCPDEGPCNRGIYTGCVDQSSGPQTVANPYIFTCRASSVCYKNVFEGGFFQYGCGSASNLATTVLGTAPGKGRLQLDSVSVALTATPTALPQPTTLTSDSTETSTPGSTSTTTAASTTTTTTSTNTGPGSTTSSTSSALQPTSTDGGAAPPSDGGESRNTGAIVGGVVGGIAAVVLLGVIAVFLRRRMSQRDGGGPGEVSDARSMGISSPQPMTARQEVSGVMAPPRNVAAAHGSDRASLESGVLGNTVPRPENIGTAITRNGGPSAESDRVPLTGELEEFSHGFNSALDNIETDSDAENNPTTSTAYPIPRRGTGGGGVLWQQNRRRSRNLAWM